MTHTHILIIVDKDIDWIDGTGEIIRVYTQECIVCGYQQKRYARFEGE